MIICRKIIINKPEYLRLKGPVLFAANHPNSFLDGIILTTLMEQQLHALARGDVFNHKKMGRILRRLNLLPVYRISEGKENVVYNYDTFNICQQEYQNNGLVLIFSEGQTVNEWHLRPLRKGTARLALNAWAMDTDLTVIPLGFNYNTFGLLGKNVHLNFGEPLYKKPILEQETEGRQILTFNTQLKNQLHSLVYEIQPEDKATLRKIMYVPQPVGKQIMLAIPAIAGFILHLPLLLVLKGVTCLFRKDHSDSLVAAQILLGYPFYLLSAALSVYCFLGWIAAVILLAVMPFCLWAFVQLKKQI